MKRARSASSLKSPRLWMLAIAGVLLSATFANPGVRLGRDLYRYVFVFDITQSMYVRDVGEPDRWISRIEHAKAAVLSTFGILPCGSEAAMGIFSQHRTYLLMTPVEICGNYDELLRMLDRIHARMAWRSRSEVAKGIHSAIRLTAELHDDSRLVFFTDGHEAPPVNPGLRPSFEIAAYGVKGVVVGVGGSTPRPIPKFDLNWAQSGYWRAGEVMQIDPYSLGRKTGNEREKMVGVDSSNITSRIENGLEHLSAVHEPYLQRLSEEMMLDYRRLDSADSLAAFLKRSQIAQHRLAPTDARWMFTALALLLVCAAYLYGPLRPSGPR